MLVKILTVVCLFLAKSISCNSVEDIGFLKNAVTKYSPTLVKDLIINRIDHTMEHVKSVNTSVGINQDQRILCTIIYSTLDVLAQDIKSMDENQVICVTGVNSNQKTILNYITRFSLLVEMFRNQFEALKTPRVTQFTPDVLLDHLNYLKSIGSTSKIIVNETLDSLTAFIEDIESKANETNASYVQKVFASSIVRQLHNLSSEVSNMSNPNIYNYNSVFTELINQFKQYIDIFYRQFSMLAEIVTPGDAFSFGVELTDQYQLTNKLI